MEFIYYIFVYQGLVTKFNWKLKTDSGKSSVYPYLYPKMTNISYFPFFTRSGYILEARLYEGVGRKGQDWNYRRDYDGGIVKIGGIQLAGLE